MTQYAKLTDGCVTRFGRNDHVPEDCVLVPDEIPYWSIPNMRLTEGAWALRPALPSPQTVAGVTTMTGAPSGTVCEVNDLDGGAILATVTEASGVIAIDLPDPGRYALDYAPPLPYLPLAVTVVIP
jgi:hypothetical protein